jgi:hypothetical protein
MVDLPEEELFAKFFDQFQHLPTVKELLLSGRGTRRC